MLIKQTTPCPVTNTFAAIATGPGLAFRLSHHPMLLRSNRSYIDRFNPGLNSTFNRWSKYSNSIQHCDLSKPLKKTRTDVSARTRKGIDRATYSRIRDLCDHTAASNVQSYSPAYWKSIPMSYPLCCLLKATRSHHGLSTRVSVDYGDQQMTDFAYLKQYATVYRKLLQPTCALSAPHQLSRLLLLRTLSRY